MENWKATANTFYNFQSGGSALQYTYQHCLLEKDKLVNKFLLNFFNILEYIKILM